tara:strand:- start:6214 stop:6450 length:237 start_codon:yes stop_codon:yes gene_type:complete
MRNRRRASVQENRLPTDCEDHARGRPSHSRIRARVIKKKDGDGLLHGQAHGKQQLPEDLLIGFPQHGDRCATLPSFCA